MEAQVEIKIVIRVGETDVELTLEEARDLQALLNNILHPRDYWIKTYPTGGTSTAADRLSNAWTTQGTPPYSPYQVSM